MKQRKEDRKTERQKEKKRTGIGIGTGTGKECEGNSGTSDLTMNRRTCNAMNSN
jgi:hypothetical protein